MATSFSLSFPTSSSCWMVESLTSSTWSKYCLPPAPMVLIFLKKVDLDCCCAVRSTGLFPGISGFSMCLLAMSLIVPEREMRE